MKSETCNESIRLVFLVCPSTPEQVFVIKDMLLSQVATCARASSQIFVVGDLRLLGKNLRSLTMTLHLFLKKNKFVAFEVFRILNSIPPPAFFSS